ncbi:DUF5655 domain-containing protein [Methylococcus sp. EFPC2]|uniref:DUF5655 domain-containing protein n=1 Tax=Methylococcus sp. EFPC2 TaxID=2812648 RepID=UPI00196840B9|nr:DUF5655 domain-containing protein [Methylococcus sp. EFPC2]QSA97797.1 hypothetical protein JWZ97_02910 [Methylococcus sp. EFPC2]
MGSRAERYFPDAPNTSKDLYEEVKSFLPALGDDVQEKELQNYFAFRRIKNFACTEVHPEAGKLLI